MFKYCADTPYLILSFKKILAPTGGPLFRLLYVSNCQCSIKGAFLQNAISHLELHCLHLKINFFTLTLGRWQSKTLITIDKRGSKISGNSVFDCHLSPVGDKWQLKTLFLNIFYLRSWILLTFSSAAYPV